jgi:hypothetical protein
VYQTYGIDESVVGAETYGFGLDEGGNSIDRAQTLVDECQGSAYVGFPIAKVGAKAKV